MEMVGILLGAAGPAGAVLPSDQVRVPLQAEPLVAEEMAERVITPGEPFLRQRLTALKSATLEADVAVPTHTGVIPRQQTWMTLPKGTRLILATSAQHAYFCASYTLSTAQVLATSRFKLQWVCFDDENGDGVFDQVYETPPNVGAFLPTFASVLNPNLVSVPYRMDDDGQRFFFERALVQGSGLFGTLSFIEKARRQDDDQWSNFAAMTSSTFGWMTNVKGAYPLAVELGGLKFTVLANGGKAGLAVHPDGAMTGVVGFTTKPCADVGRCR